MMNKKQLFTYYRKKNEQRKLWQALKSKYTLEEIAESFFLPAILTPKQEFESNKKLKEHVFEHRAKMSPEKIQYFKDYAKKLQKEDQ